MELLCAVPALPVGDIVRSVEFYRDSSSSCWPTMTEASPSCAAMRSSFTSGPRPMRAGGPGAAHCPWSLGAGSFLARTAGCRVGVEGVDVLHRAIQRLAVSYPGSRLEDTHPGKSKVGMLDPDDNLATFLERT
jgi:hypothetical protein